MNSSVTSKAAPMVPDLTLTVESAASAEKSVTPEIVFSLKIENRPQLTIQNILLYCQIQLAVPQRGYNTDEQQELVELFGRRDQWGRTLRRIVWTNINLIVPGFTGSTVVDVHAPCTFDFNIAATKYFAALEHGDVPLSFYFNGTIFYQDEDGQLRVTPISWEKEAHFAMPAQVWHDMMDFHYRNLAWLCLRRDVFDKLRHYKANRGLATFEDALEEAIR